MVMYLVAPHGTVVWADGDGNRDPAILLLTYINTKRGDQTWIPPPYSAPIWHAPPEDKQAKEISTSIPARRSAASAQRVIQLSPPRKARSFNGCAPQRS